MPEIIIKIILIIAVSIFGGVLNRILKNHNFNIGYAIYCVTGYIIYVIVNWRW